jgi:hypothetical protein
LDRLGIRRAYRATLASLRKETKPVIFLYVVTAHSHSISLRTPIDIEAEVRYAVHNEYALTAIDFLSRRSRLTFLNAQIALDALPRVVEIMGDELGWSKWRRNKEIRDTEIFMESMGVPFGMRRYRIGWTEWLAHWVDYLAGRGAGKRVEDAVIAGAVKYTANISRAQFDPGEIDRLRRSFTRRIPTVDTENKWLSIEDARTLVTEKVNLGW